MQETKKLIVHPIINHPLHYIYIYIYTCERYYSCWRSQVPKKLRTRRADFHARVIMRDGREDREVVFF